jgi:hypothetical protein
MARPALSASMPRFTKGARTCGRQLNVRSCRDPCLRPSQINWRTTVAHHPTEDKADWASRLTSFSTSSRRALQGPKARRHRRAGRLPATPLRYVLGASLGLARTCQQGAGSKTAERAINDRHPVVVVLSGNGRLLAPGGRRCLRRTVSSRIAALAIVEGTARPGTPQGRLRRPCGISDP